MDKRQEDVMSIVVVGSVGLDSIETPSGRADEVLGARQPISRLRRVILRQ